ncbi:MAG TPA: NAD(+)/NADH kinase [Candidatus Intestinimonas stercoravium]|uniref:NAD(+)/NADH kinase n=1 Tax=uncultured Intestinimonas sp. TaxID=1689265 RepID=UPI001FA2FE50|nr:NAD(+)/NADH kinase [uncultured Intestinimonas sp.]HJA63371.1 NAD(+)/NADH kinase [Candidatus Intestinimonas stercoravium]
MKVVLSPNPYRDRGLKVAIQAKRVLERAGVRTAVCLPFELEGANRSELPGELAYSEMEKELPGADMLICFGGDGTILHAARDAYPWDIPILGVNMGSVGFMAELEHGELEKLAQIGTGKYATELRMMLDVAVRRGREVLRRDVALNDAVITKGAVARVIDLAVRADGVRIYDYSGDGVILSTPTGSTAYSMSAGGPIVEPTAENILVTPICAHSLQAKPLVMGRDRLVSVRLGRTARKTAYLSVDGGRAFKLSGGDVVEVRRSQKYTRLVRLTAHSFYENINQKLRRA